MLDEKITFFSIKYQNFIIIHSLIKKLYPFKDLLKSFLKWNIFKYQFWKNYKLKLNSVNGFRLSGFFFPKKTFI